MQDLDKLKRFDEQMRQRFGVRWAEPAPVAPEDRGEKQPESQPEKEKPNRRENEFMLNLMILRNTLFTNGPAMKERARKAGKTVWRDLRLMTRLCEKLQDALLKTMPDSRGEYYRNYALHGHYELIMNGPIRNKRLILVSDKYMAAVCEEAMENACCMCMREGSEIGTCLLRQALLEVAPPTEVQDGKWRKCEYREAAGSLIREEDVTI